MVRNFQKVRDFIEKLLQDGSLNTQQILERIRARYKYAPNMNQLAGLLAKDLRFQNMGFEKIGAEGCIPNSRRSYRISSWRLRR